MRHRFKYLIGVHRQHLELDEVGQLLLRAPANAARGQLVGLVLGGELSGYPLFEIQLLSLCDECAGGSPCLLFEIPGGRIPPVGGGRG